MPDKYDMKKKMFLAVFFFPLVTGLFGQTEAALRLATLGVFPFVAGEGSSGVDAAALSIQVVEELRSWGTLSILEGEAAEKAEYTVKCRLVRQGNQLILTAATYDAKGKELNSSREQASDLNGLSARIFSFCAQLTENIPFPNYLLGTWQSVIDLESGPLVCIIEFQAGRRVLVKRFDTYEQRGSQSLRYQAVGTGTYTYWGHARRNIGGLSADATFSLNASLEDALPKYESPRISRRALAFDEGKNSFQMGGGLPCGDRTGEPGLAYTRFTRIP
jgi:hypothetical protein